MFGITKMQGKIKQNIEGHPKSTGKRSKRPHVTWPAGAPFTSKEMSAKPLTCSWLPEASQERGRIPGDLGLATNSSAAQGQRAAAAAGWAATLAISMAAREP